MRIDELLAHKQLTKWEREFLHSILYVENLTAKQQQTLARIEAKVQRSAKVWSYAPDD